MSRCLRIAPTDNVAVALEPVAAGIAWRWRGLPLPPGRTFPRGTSSH